MPGSVVAAPAVETGAPSEQTHVNGHCNAPVVVGVDAKTASLAAAGCDAIIGNAMNGGLLKGDSHAPGCPAHSADAHAAPHRAKTDDKPSKNVAPTASGAEDESEAGSNGVAHAARSESETDDKGTTPETTPAGSDGPAGSPSCRASESTHSTAVGSPEASANPAFSSSMHSHSSNDAATSSAEVSAEAKSKASDDAASSETAASKDEVETKVEAKNMPLSPSRKRSPSGTIEEAADRPPKPVHAEPPVVEIASSKKDEEMQGASTSCAAHQSCDTPASAAASSSAQPDAAKESKATDRNSGDELLSADQQLVESLIAAAAANTVDQNDDTLTGNAPAARHGGAFALLDAASLKLSHKEGDEPSAEDKLVMQTLLGLAEKARQKSEEATGDDEDCDDDDDDAASAPDSSSRQDAGSDADNMDDDSKGAKDSKSAKMPGKPGRKKKKDKEDDADEGDDDADDDADGTKSSRKSKKDADGDEPKPKGRRGKKSDMDGIDRNLSREERKMLAIMRQFEQMEQKEKAKNAPSTPRTEGKGGDREKDELSDSEAPASHRKRKEGDEDEGASARKKNKPDEDKTTSPPRAVLVDAPAEAKPATLPKARGRPPNQKLTGKQKMVQEKEAVGALVSLRKNKASNDAPLAARPLLTDKSVYSAAAASVHNEYSAVTKCLRFPGKKSYCWIQAALADLAQHEPHTKAAPEWLPATRKARLNPHRRLIDKKRFPVIKSALARWTHECKLNEKSAAARALYGEVETKMEIKEEANDDIKMEVEEMAEVAEPEEVTAEPEEVTAKPEEVTAKPHEVMAESSASPTATAPVDIEVEEASQPASQHQTTADVTPEILTENIKAERGAEEDPKPSAEAVSSEAVSSALSSSKPDARISRREVQHGDSERGDADRHGPSTPSVSNYTGSDRSRFRDAPAGGQGITTGYGSLAITIPVGGSQHASQYGWEGRARSSDASPLLKNEGGQDFGGNPDQPRWQRGAESPGVWMGPREAAGPPPVSLPGPNSPSKIANAASAANSWDRGRDRSEGRSSKGDQDQDARWQRGKESPGHWMGKRDGSGAQRDGSGAPPMPSSPRVGDPGAWGRGRTSAWDQPPSQGEIQRGELQREGSLTSKDAMPDRDLDRSSAIRNLPDMREMRREPSPPVRRGRAMTPPRSIYGNDMRDRGMDMGVGGGGGGGGLSRESLRREREDALQRDRDPPEREPHPHPPPPRFMRSEIVRSEIVRSEMRSNAPERASDSPRSRGMLNQWDLGPRARSPRPIDRPIERPPLGDRPGMGRALSPVPRDRSLSPRSKEVQREMQVARESRRGDRKDEWGRDIPEGRRDGSECSPGPDDRDLPPALRPMLGGPSGAGRGGWWGGPGRARSGGPSVDDRPPAGIGRRQRPSMFAARRQREDGYSNSPPRSR